MGYAFEMFFDSETEKKIRELWTALARKKLASFMFENDVKPHISLSVYNNLDVETANEKLAIFCRNHKPIQIILCFPGSFVSDDNVIFIAPIMNGDLLNIHSDFHTEFKGNKDGARGFYLPDNWQPHCTVAMETPENRYLETFNEIRKNFKPFIASIQSVGLVEFRPINVLYEYNLG